jgi:hypothetical protein
MNNKLYELILTAILNEASTVGGGGGVTTGSITGMSLPLGTSPEDYSNIEIEEEVPAKKKRKKKKVYSRSVQHYLKYGGEKTRKRKFK